MKLRCCGYRTNRRHFDEGCFEEKSGGYASTTSKISRNRLRFEHVAFRVFYNKWKFWAKAVGSKGIYNAGESSVFDGDEPAERQEEPEKPFSGTFTVRVPSELHREIYIQARLANKSLNSWVNEVFEQQVSSGVHKKQFQPIGV